MGADGAPCGRLPVPEDPPCEGTLLVWGLVESRLFCFSLLWQTSKVPELALFFGTTLLQRTVRPEGFLQPNGLLDTEVKLTPTLQWAFGQQVLEALASHRLEHSSDSHTQVGDLVHGEGEPLNESPQELVVHLPHTE